MVVLGFYIALLRSNLLNSAYTYLRSIHLCFLKTTGISFRYNKDLRKIMECMPQKINMLGRTFNYWTVLKQVENNKFNKTTWLCRCKCGTRRKVEGKSLRNGTSASCGCKPHHELSGKKFGEWTVISYSDNKDGKGTRWLCTCSCGKNRVVHSSELLRGASKSCGCKSLNAKKIMTGKQVGFWTVIGEEKKNRHGQIQWLCKCICGTQRLITGPSLRRRPSSSCGCRGKLVGDVGFNAVFGMYQKSARKRGIEWNLSLDQFKKINKLECYYCGQIPSRLSESKKIKSENLRKRSSYIYNGVDRVDSSEGYFVENCVPCCTICNKAKLDTPREEFLTWVERVYKFRIKGKK